MKKIILSLGLLVVLSFGSTVQDAMKAYEKGDFQTGITILQNLSKKGDLEAKFFLAGAYLDGEGVEQNPKKAKKMYEELAQEGHTPSKVILLTICEDEPQACK